MATSSATTLDVDAIRARFPALARTGPDDRPFVWADAPGGSQAPDTVIEAIAGRLRAGSSNTHGMFATSAEIDAVVAAAHEAGADFLGCDPDEVVFGQNATSLLLHLSRSFARTLSPRDEVVVTRLDHDANVRPWVLAARDAGATVRWVDVREDDVTLDLDSLDAQLSERTKLVAVTLASNAVGAMPPIGDVIARAKAVGALVALDGVHFAQHHLPDLHGWGADLVATALQVLRTTPGHARRAAHAPRGLGALQAPPGRGREPGPLGDRHPEPRVAGRTVAAIDYLAEVGGRAAAAATAPRRRVRRDRMPTSRPRRRGSSTGARRVPGPASDRHRGPRTPARADADVRDPPAATSTRSRRAKALGERGIFVWDGHYYAIEVFERLGLLDSGGAVRIGFCHYHTPSEVDRVLERAG